MKILLLLVLLGTLVIAAGQIEARSQSPRASLWCTIAQWLALVAVGAMGQDSGWAVAGGGILLGFDILLLWVLSHDTKRD